MDNIIDDVTRVTERLQQRSDYAQMSADARKRIETQILNAIRTAATFAWNAAHDGESLPTTLTMVENEWNESLVVIDADALRNL